VWLNLVFERSDLISITMGSVHPINYFRLFDVPVRFLYSRAQ